MDKKKQTSKKSKDKKKRSKSSSNNNKSIKSARSLNQPPSAVINTEELKLPPINSPSKIPLIEVILNSARNSDDNPTKIPNIQKQPEYVSEKTSLSLLTMPAKFDHVTELVPKNVVVDHSMNVT